MNIIITSTQRSGTATAANIFNLQHETLFNPFRQRPLPGTTIQEASWLAAPYLQYYTYCRVIHLVRNPVDVINSLLGIKFFEDIAHKPYRDYIFKHLESIEKHPVLRQCILYWVYWNKLVEPYAVARIRIEDIHTDIHLNARQKEDRDIVAKRVANEDTLRELAHEYGYTEQELFPR